MPEFTVYVTGGVEYFYHTLNAVASMFNDGQLIYSVIALGAMFALMTGAWSYIQRSIGSGLMRSHTWVEHGVVMILMTFVAFIPTRLVIQDIYGEQHATPVDNVPLIVTIPATMFSSIGYDVFRMVDTSFQSVNGSTMTVSETGFVTPLKLMLAMRGGLQEVAPEAYKTWFNYIVGCTYASGTSSGGVMHAPDVSDYLLTTGRDGSFIKSFLRESGGTISAVESGVMVTCAEAKGMLSMRMDALFASGGPTNPDSDMDRKINNSMSEVNHRSASGKWSWNDVHGAYEAYQLEVGGGGQSAQQFMKNALMKSVVTDAFQCGNAGLSNADQVACSSVMNDAMEQYKIDAAGRGSWFTKIMLPSMTILQMLFFAFSVIAFLYAMLRGAGAFMFMGKYFLFGAWVFSWLPFVAIINAFIHWMAIDKMSAMARQGLTLENYDAFFEGVQSNLALASDLLAATPLITLGFLTGSMYAMSGFANRLSSNDYVKESNLAPNTLDVAPVMRFNEEFKGDAVTGSRSSATSFENIDVSQAATELRQSASEERYTSQSGMLESYSKMREASVMDSGSTTISDSDTNRFSVQNANMIREAESATADAARQAGYGEDEVNRLSREAGAQVGARVAGTGAGVGVDHVKAKSDFEKLDYRSQEVVSAGIDKAVALALTDGNELANGITHNSTNQNTDATKAAASFNESRAQLHSANESFTRTTALADQMSVSRGLEVPQLASFLHRDAGRPNGHGSDIVLAGAMEQAYAKHGREPVDALVRQKEESWEDTVLPGGKTGAAQVLTLNQLGERQAYGQLVGMATASSVPTADPLRNEGVSNNAANISVVDSGANRDSFVSGAVPNAGAGRASVQSNSEMSDRMMHNMQNNPNFDPYDLRERHREVTETVTQNYVRPNFGGNPAETALQQRDADAERMAGSTYGPGSSNMSPIDRAAHQPSDSDSDDGSPGSGGGNAPGARGATGAEGAAGAAGVAASSGASGSPSGSGNRANNEDNSPDPADSSGSQANQDNGFNEEGGMSVDISGVNDPYAPPSSRS